MRLHTKVLILIVAWVTLGHGTIHAQKVSLKDVKLELSLQDYRLEDIIDGTPDEDHIGYGYKGVVNSTLTKIYFDDSVTEEFEEIFKPVFSKSKDAIPLVIRINSIEVNEWAEFLCSKVNLVSLSLSIFQQVQDDKYILIADRVINDFNTHDLDKIEIGSLIGKAINRAFDYLDLYVDPNKPGLTWSELWEYEPFQGLPSPRLIDDLKLYEHYSDFRQNKPFEGASVELVEQQGQTTLLDEKGAHPIDIWGFTSGGVLHINTGQRFLSLDRVDKSYATILKGGTRGLESSQKNRFLGLDKILAVLALATNQKAFELRLKNQTGYLDIKSTYDLVEVKERSSLDDKNIIEFAPFGHPDDILEVKSDGKVIIQLSKGEFFQVSNDLKSKELLACIDGKCTALVLDDTPMHRITFKKGRIAYEPFTEKERMRYLRNVDLKYWVLF